MILREKSINRVAIGNEWENYNVEWKFEMEESDFIYPKMMDRFKWVSLEMKVYTGKHSDFMGNIHLWYKAYRTNTFGPETKDKQKKFVIQLVNNFIANNDEPLIMEFQKPNEN
jgi:hypothetical protein